MRLAYTSGPAGQTDAVLVALADAMATAGRQSCGSVQTVTQGSDEVARAMDLLILPDKRPVRISMPLPPGTPGCCLDPGALEAAAHAIANSLTPDADLAILSKFGLREAEGRGLRPALARAVELDLPVVIGVAPQHEPAFLEFTGGAGTRVPANVADIIKWLDTSVT